MYGRSSRSGFFREGGPKVTKPPERKPLRDTYKKIIQDAARAGIRDAHSFWHKTPDEIGLIITAHSANAERQDAFIWQLGQYVAIGVNAPKKYPKPPKQTKVQNEPDSMDDDTIKESLLMFADIHNQSVKEVLKDASNA